MEASELRVFEAVARLGGMSRAASELSTVQSNVTARIGALERELGTALFARHSRGVTLTAAGRRLLPFAVGVASLLADARRAVIDDGEPEGPLVLGSLETTAGLRLPGVLSDFVGRFPRVDLVLRTGTTETLVAQVLARGLEGAFVCGPVAHEELVAEPAFREELVLVTTKAVRRVADLARRPEVKVVVFRAGCSYRRKLEAVLARLGVVGARALELGTLDGILGCVAAGLGVTLLPRALAVKERTRRGLRVHALPREESAVETLFVRRRDAFASSALRAFLALARSRPRP